MAQDKEASQFSLIIVSPDQTLFEGDATKVTVPGIIQELAILPDHTPLYSQLNTGRITVQAVGESAQTFDIEGGVIRVRSNRVSIITGFDLQSDQQFTA